MRGKLHEGKQIKRKEKRKRTQKYNLKVEKEKRKKLKKKARDESICIKKGRERRDRKADGERKDEKQMEKVRKKSR